MPVRRWWWCLRAFLLCICIQLVLLLIVSTWDNQEQQIDEINTRLVNYDYIKDLVNLETGKEREDNLLKPSITASKIKVEPNKEDTIEEQNIKNPNFKKMINEFKVKANKEDIIKPNFQKKTNHMCPNDGCPSLCINNTFTDAFYGANISSYKDLSEPWEASRTYLDQMEQRRQTVKEVCQKYSLATPSSRNKVNAWEFMINHDHNLAWCNVFKAASSAWMYVFSRLAGYSDQIMREAVATDNVNLSPLLLARRCYKRLSEQELLSVMQSDPEPTSFMVTRHPLERLVSYYRNKYIDDIPDKYIRSECKSIKNIYKHFIPRRDFVDPGLNPDSGCGMNLPNFVQFIAHVIDKVKKKSKNLNMHWVPMYQFCSACLVDFKVFAKVDTMDEDGEYILHSAGINDFITLSKQNAGKLGESKNLAESYLCQLPQKMMDQLIQVYQYDLEMFQYDSEKYIICTRNQR